MLQRHLPESSEVWDYPRIFRALNFPEFHPPSTAGIHATDYRNVHDELSNRRVTPRLHVCVQQNGGKKRGRMEVYACTLVDDDPDYVLGETLTEALQIPVSMKHHRCYSCFKYGASCSEMKRGA